MDTSEFRERGRELIDYIADYHDSISLWPVTPAVEPGFMRNLIPMEYPEKGENWERIMKDIDAVIMPGITHWIHPNFHAYFPNGFSYVSLLADLLCYGIPCVGFSWISSPSCTELETVVLEWLAKMIGLPDDFLFFKENSRAGNVLLSSGSESNFTCLLAARGTKIEKLKKDYPKIPKPKLAHTLVAYCSKEANSSTEKAAKLGLVKLRILDTDNEYRLRGQTLEEAIKNDLKNGLHPFYVIATLGTFSCTSSDLLRELGPICKKYEVWLHVDATYAGNALICSEFKYLLEGVEHASSFTIDAAKWLPVNVDAAAIWMKNRTEFIKYFVVDPIYLHHQHANAIDYRHYTIHLSRRFRALKLWFVIRYFGTNGLKRYIRNHINLAKIFEQHVRNDDRFEISNDVTLGLVCFRLKATNILNSELVKVINKTRKLFLTPISLGGNYVIRFCVCYPKATEKDITFAWKVITECANELLEANK